MTTPKLTEKQAALLAFIRGYMEQHGRAPTIVEMCTAKGTTAKSGVHKMLVFLEEQGIIRRTRAYRGIELLN